MMSKNSSKSLTGAVIAAMTGAVIAAILEEYMMMNRSILEEYIMMMNRTEIWKHKEVNIAICEPSSMHRGQTEPLCLR
jgi:hypothetical protein